MIKVASPAVPRRLQRRVTAVVRGILAASTAGTDVTIAETMALVRNDAVEPSAFEIPPGFKKGE
jgi:hypothetical protein